MKKIATLAHLEEIQMLREMLEKEGIPLLIRHKESGDFLAITTGMNVYGADLYVDDAHAESAEGLYRGFFEGEAEFDRTELPSGGKDSDFGD